METVLHCPVCEGSLFSTYQSCKDYLISNEEFTIQQCKTCGFRLTNPRPDTDKIGAYYKSDQYISHNDKSSSLIDVAYRAVRNYTLRSKVNLITTLHGGKGSILDVGCGTGAFLESCKKDGWHISGTEPDKDANAVARTKLQSTIATSLDQLPSEQTYDIITLWHVLEHVPDLNKTVQQLHQLLSENGTLIIAVPNSDSYDANYFKEYWAAYDVPRHLHHFTPTTIKPLFEKHQFVLKEKRPMLFDAFYIGLLSTKYQTGKSDYLKSIQVGLKSNSEAKRTGNASSQIYLFKKA